MRVFLLLITSLHLLASSNLSLKKVLDTYVKAGVDIQFKDIKDGSAMLKITDKGPYSALILSNCKSVQCQNIKSLQLVTWIKTNLNHNKLLDISNKLNKNTLFSTFYVTKQTIVLKSNMLAGKKEQTKKLLNFLATFMAVKDDFVERMKNE